LMTANQQPADILSGQEIPYQQATTSGATSISFQKAVLNLAVTPQITPGGNLVLTLHLSQDRPTSTLIRGVPIIETRQLQTLVTVKNGQTVVLGGIYEQNEEKNVERVPFFGEIPLIGSLFRHTLTKNTRRELLIFITPSIIKD
jgi:type IV pilus assembly protein PilQ